MLGHAIGSHWSDKRIGGSGDLHLGTGLDWTFLDPLIAAYRLSVIHVSLISFLDGPALNWCEQEHVRTQMIEMVLFGKMKDPKLMVLNFRVQLQCRMGE